MGGANFNQSSFATYTSFTRTLLCAATAAMGLVAWLSTARSSNSATGRIVPCDVLGLAAAPALKKSASDLIQLPCPG